MKHPTILPEHLVSAFERPGLGVIGLVDELLDAALRRPLRLNWRVGRCQLELLGPGTPERIEIAIPKSVFRAILARIAALCNEQSPHSVSPYGGKSQLTFRADPHVTIDVKFANTSETQNLELSVESNPIVGDIILDLDSILKCLNHYHQRATFGAIAPLIGVIPLGVMNGRERIPFHSWVVADKNHEPPGYSNSEKDPDLYFSPFVIDDSQTLRRWLSSRHPC